MGNASNYNLNTFYSNLKNNDPLYKYQFFVEFYNLRDYGIKDDTGYYFKSATIPGYTLETAKVPFFGTEFRTPGVQKFSHNWTATLLATEDFGVYDSFQRWRDSISNLRRDGGGSKGISDAYAKINILNEMSGVDTGRAIILAGIWIAKLPNIQLAYAQGGGNTPDLQIEFRYQYNYYEANGNPLESR